jgi:hypothetical protein
VTAGGATAGGATTGGVDASGDGAPGSPEGGGGSTGGTWAGGTTEGLNGGSNLPSAGRLSAGQWSDLDDWVYWRLLMDFWSHLEVQWGFDTQHRIAVTATDFSGEPVVDAEVRAEDPQTGDLLWSARTDNKGRANAFVGLHGQQPPTSVRIEVRHGSSAPAVAFTAASSDELVEVAVVIEADLALPILDLMIVLDTTSSMADEAAYLAAELADVVQSVQAVQGADLEIRSSAVFYRDQGDQYVTKVTPFAPGIVHIVGVLQSESIAAGGDYP